MLLFPTLGLRAQQKLEISDYLNPNSNTITIVDVYWDIPNSKFLKEQFLGEQYSISDWENKILPSVMTSFLDGLNKKTSMYGLLFKTNEETSKLEMSVSLISFKKTWATGTVVFSIREKDSKNEILKGKHVMSGNAKGSLEKRLCSAFNIEGLSLGNTIKKDLKTNKKPLILKGQNVFNYRFDFSQMTIEGIATKEYLFLKSEEKDNDIEQIFSKFSKKVEIAFVAIANKGLSNKCKLDNKENQRFEIVICPMVADEDGGHDIMSKVVDKTTGEVVASFKSHAGGGKWNSFENLFLEELEDSGKQFSEKLVSFM